MDSNIIGERLKSLREGAKLSQAKISLLLGGMQSTIVRYEKGEVAPSNKTLLWYADYFDVSLDYIFGRTDNPHGEYYNFKPPVNPNNEELKEFVEMCFDPESSMNSRLKEAIMKMLEEKKK